MKKFADFDLLLGQEIATLEQLEWVGESCDIDNRRLVVFLSNNEFLYVNRDKELVWVGKSPYLYYRIIGCEL